MKSKTLTTDLERFEAIHSGAKIRLVVMGGEDTCTITITKEQAIELNENAEYAGLVFSIYGKVRRTLTIDNGFGS